MFETLFEETISNFSEEKCIASFLGKESHMNISFKFPTTKAFY